MSITLDITDKTALITMDDGKANAQSFDMLTALDEALSEAEAKASAAVLTGRPGKFCAGFDLTVMQGGDVDQMIKLVHQGGVLALRMYQFPLPLVAACNGHALALGAIYLLASDTRIGEDVPAKIGLNETAIGMELPVFGTALGEARIPPHKLTEAVIQATIYDPKGAMDVGYLDRVVGEGEAIAAALDTAGRLGQLPGAAYAGTKRKIRRATIAEIEESLKV